MQTWPITSLIEYNTEKKHLFIELSSPPAPASFHFHAASRALATEISDAIGEIAGATRATGLREVAAAIGEPLPPLPETSALAQRHKREDSDDQILPVDDGIKRGVMLYDFEAQGEDELAVRQDQIVEILDSSHEEWWKCKAGSREGVVPASYVDVIKTRPAKQTNTNSAAAALATAVTSPRKQSSSRSTAPAESRADTKTSLSKPDMNKIRTWTDRSGTFKVEAQFLGLIDGKIQLHKLNGVKISVPLAKMSVDDVQFVERLVGRGNSPTPPKPPPDSEKPRPKKSDYDWYSFFLECGVDYNVCQRYAVAFDRDQMDETILPDINPDTLRTLGVREGDILRIMKRLDEKFGRTAARKKSVRFGGEQLVDEDEKDDLSDVVKISQPADRRESLFSSGPGGVLRNNTSRRGRPTTAKTAPEEVDGSLLSTSTPTAEEPRDTRHGVSPLRVPASRLANFQEKSADGSGFDDDAWTVKQERANSQAQVQPAPTQPAPAAQTGPPPNSAMHELATINPQASINPQTLPPAMQPQSPPVIQIAPQPTASPMVNRPSSVPPGQSAPQMQPLQPHYTGVPQQQYSGPTPAAASGTPSLNEQLAQLTLYRQQQQQQQQQQQLQPQQTGYIPQFQSQQTGYMNGFSSMNGQVPQITIQQTGLQPQQTGLMPNFLPPGQQSSQLGPTRSFSVGLPPSLIPTNPAPPQPQFIATHRTGPANFSSPPQQQQFPPQFQPQQTGFQPQQTGLPPQQTGLPPQQTGFQQQQTGFQPPSFLPPSTLLPQQTGFQQLMLPQNTGMPKPEFHPVSFGGTKPAVPNRTKRANLSAASMFPFDIVDGSAG
jgi:actin cytoskeleton-regulatory complex protein SLA1